MPMLNVNGVTAVSIMHELVKRIAVAAVAIPCIVYIILYAGGLSLALVGLLIAGIASLEWHFITQTSPMLALGQIGLVVALFTLLPVSWFLLLVGILWVLGFSMMCYPRPWALKSFGLLYVCLVLAGLRSAMLVWLASPWYLLNITALIWVADSLAYFVGRQWGRWPLWPSVSPKKSWQGCFAALTPLLFWPMLPWFITGLIIIGGILGDLLESQFKRLFNVKDSSALIPGHGGCLDRLDSLVAAWFIGSICLQY